MSGPLLPVKELSLEQLTVFRQAALILTSSLDLDDALTNAISACLPFIGDFGFFDVVLQDKVRRTAGAYGDPELQVALAASSWNRQERTDINLCALSTGQPALHENTDDIWFAHAFGNAPRTLPFNSMLSVPVFHGIELIGSLTLFMGRSGRHHSQADLHFAAELSSLAAPIVVKARLMAQQHVLNGQLEERVAERTTERDRIWRLCKDILAVANFDGVFTAVNPSFTSLLGWTHEEAQAAAASDLLHPADLPQWTSQVRTLAQGKQQSQIECRWKSKGGTYIWISWTLVSENDAIYCAGRDVTELHRQRAQVLRENEQRFRLALQVGGMGAWQWNVIENKVTWWPGMAELHGMPSGSGLNKVQDYLLLVHPDDRELAGRSLGGKLDENAGKGIEYRIVCPDGSIRWLEGRGEITQSEQGTPVTMSGVCVDVTERKLTEQRLRFLAKASTALAELVDHEETMARIAGLAVPDFADWCTVDLLSAENALKRVAVTHIDPAKVELAHELHRRYPPDPAVPTGTWQVIRTGQSALIAEITDDMLAASVNDADYLQIIRDLGLRSYIGVPLSVRGKTIGVLTFISAESQHIYTAADVVMAEEIARRAGVAIDNSFLYRTLQESDRRKDEFLAMLGHELRNPLAPISAAAQLLAGNADPAHVQRASDVIARQVAHMTVLVDDLLDVSRVTRGDVVLQMGTVDMRNVVQAAVEQVRPLIQRKSQFLNITTSQDNLFIEGDQNRLVQILSNVLNNAAKFTQPGGDIHLHAELDGSEVKISVRDNGAGMAPALLNGAFELFVQGATTIDRSQGGLGIGLALVKHLVGLHGGSVSAYSDGPDTGSLFIIRIPLAQQHKIERGPVMASDAASNSTGMRFLIVDDNVDAALTLSMLLEVAGHKVELAHHPFDALDFLDKTSYDVVLLDIGLPDLDGRELARRIRAGMHGNMPLIIGISGYGQLADRDSGLAAGMDHYLIKPINTQELLLLTGAAPLRSHASQNIARS